MRQWLKQHLHGVLVALTILIFTLHAASSFFMVQDYQADQAGQQESAFADAQRQAFTTAMQISQEVNRLDTLVSSVALDLSRGSLPFEEAEWRLEDETFKEQPYIQGLGIAFQPYAYDSDTELYAPFYVKNAEGRFERIQLEEQINYTLPPDDDPETPDTRWYQDAITTGGGWVEPRFSEDNTLTLYNSVPFYRLNPVTVRREIAGVVFVTLSLPNIEQLIASLDLGATGYGYILDHTGTYLVHPVQEYVGFKTIFQVATDEGIPALEQEGERAINREIFWRDFVDAVTNRSAWVFYEPIPTTRWTLGVVLQKDEFSGDQQATRRRQIQIGLMLAGTAFWGSVVLFRPYRPGVKRAWWRVSLVFSAVCLGMIILIWTLRLRQERDNTESTIMVDHTGVRSFLEERTANLPVEPIYIPTGMFVQSIKFNSANDIRVTGYIWQRYAAGLPEEIERGFTFPDGDWTQLQEAYHYHDDITQEEVVGWYFVTTIRLSPDYSSYPLDKVEVAMRVLPKAFNQGVVFTPDLSAYPLINPDLKPGINEEIVLDGWQTEKTFFSYKPQAYSTDFGMNLPTVDDLQMSFSVVLERIFLDTLIGQFVPLTVLAIMVFAVMILTVRKSDFDGFSVLSYCAALLFAALVSHNGLRQNLVFPGIVYLEYFYILLYATILLVSLDFVLIISKADMFVIRYENNLIPCLLYWPVLLASSLMITLLIFY